MFPETDLTGSRRRALARALVLSLLVALAAGPVLAQTTGSVRGEVVDQDRQPMPGVTIELTGDVVRGERTTVTGDTGTFLFSAIPPGSVTLTASLEGFRTEVVEDLQVGISTTAWVEIAMSLETITETLTVFTESPIVDVTSSSVGTNLSSEFIEDLPMNRSMHDFMSVTPGISQSSEEGVRFSAFGSSTSSNTWSIDGLNATAGDTGNSWWYINPDIVSEVQVLGIGAPAEYGQMSGAAINIVTKSGTNQHKGRINWYEQLDSLTEENVQLPSMDGTRYGHSRDAYRNVTLTGGGPIKEGRLWYFGAVEYYKDAITLPGVAPELANPYLWDRYDVKISSALTPSNSLEAKWHYEDYEYNDSTDPFTTPDATGVEFGTNPAWGLVWSSVLTNKSYLEAAYAGWEGDDFWRSVTGSLEPAFVDFTLEVPITSGGVIGPFDYYVNRDQVDVKLSHFADEFLGGDHEFKFGVQLSQGDADTIYQPGFGGVYYYKYQYGDYPYYYIWAQKPFHYGSESETQSVFVDDSWRVSDRLTVNLGVRYDRDTADIPAYPRLDNDGNETGEIIPGVRDVIDWTTVSPRVGFAYQVGEGRKGVLRASYGKYFDGNVTGNWNSPPPQVPSIYYGYSYYRNGPFYYFRVSSTESKALPDPDIDPPETDQWAIGYEHQVGDNLALGILAVVKETTNMIGWEILGDGVYEPFELTDPVTGQVLTLANVIEQPTIRKGNRPGDGSLAPPGAKYEQEYEGLVLTLSKRYSNGWSMEGSYTYSESSGRIPRMMQQVQHTPFYGSSEGSDPNNHLNAEQLLQADRKHLLQLQGNFDLPWGLEASTVLSWLSGRPYHRRAQVRLNQGLTDVILEPANDDLRLPDQTFFDVSIGKTFDLGGGTSLSLAAQVFNVLNEDTYEFWGAGYSRGQFIPSDYILPRRVMLRASFDFGGS